jgi:hypothetical protein
MLREQQWAGDCMTYLPAAPSFLSTDQGSGEAKCGSVVCALGNAGRKPCRDYLRKNMKEADRK